MEEINFVCKHAQLAQASACAFFITAYAVIKKVQAKSLNQRGGLNWKVPGTFRGSEGTFELGINPNTNVIYHFNFFNK